MTSPFRDALPVRCSASKDDSGPNSHYCHGCHMVIFQLCHSFYIHKMAFHLRKSFLLFPVYLCVIMSIRVFSLYLLGHNPWWLLFIMVCQLSWEFLQAGFCVLSTGLSLFSALPYFLAQEAIPVYLIFILSQLSS